MTCALLFHTLARTLETLKKDPGENIHCIYRNVFLEERCMKTEKCSMSQTGERDTQQ
jgi:hypothetical protein